METPQRVALHLPEIEAKCLLVRLARGTFLTNRDVEVYAVDAVDCVLADGSKVPGAHVMVRAETEFKVGLGVGFVTAISEGLV